MLSSLRQKTVLILSLAQSYWHMAPWKQKVNNLLLNGRLEMSSVVIILQMTGGSLVSSKGGGPPSKGGGLSFSSFRWTTSRKPSFLLSRACIWKSEKRGFRLPVLSPLNGHIPSCTQGASFTCRFCFGSACSPCSPGFGTSLTPHLGTSPPYSASSEEDWATREEWGHFEKETGHQEKVQNKNEKAAVSWSFALA